MRHNLKRLSLALSVLIYNLQRNLQYSSVALVTRFGKEKCCRLLAVSHNSSFKPSANGHLIFKIIAGLSMTPAFKKVLGSQSEHKTEKTSAFQEDNFKRRMLHTFSLFLLFFSLKRKRECKNAQQEQLIKPCKSNLQRRPPHSRLNGDRENSLQ